MLDDSKHILEKEEHEDANLRGTFGVQWAIPAS